MPRNLVAPLAAVGALMLSWPIGAGSPDDQGIHDLTLAQLAPLYADAFATPGPLPDDPAAAARVSLEERSVLGRTPLDWVEWAQLTFTLSARHPASGVSATDLGDDIGRLYAALGLPFTAADRAAVAQNAAALAPPLRASFGSLVHVTVDAYMEQASLAAVMESRVTDGFDPLVPLLTRTERDATAERAARILGALNAFRAGAPEVFAPAPTAGGTDPPIFTDPEGLVVLGGTGDATYTQSGTIKDPVLLVELGGHDLYLNSAGGANPLAVLAPANLLALSVVADLDGDDVYRHDGAPALVQGAGSFGGLGILVDAQGGDQYLATMTRTNAGPFKPAGLSYFDAGGQGYGYAGFGLLLDGLGDDLYEFNVQSTQGRSIWAFAQGFGGAGGLGISADGDGEDAWLSNGLGITGDGFQGLYTAGVGFYGGVGLMMDAGQDDDLYASYDLGQTVDYYAQGFGAFGGLGILYEDGGNDRYSAIEEATDPWIFELLNCAYGTGSIGGVGVFLEVAGDDSYYGDTISPLDAHTMNEGFGGIGAAYGLFIDLQGADDHLMYAHGGTGSLTSGRGVVPAGGNIVGNYLDAGGVDVYVGPGSDNAVWVAGADQNLVP